MHINNKKERDSVIFYANIKKMSMKNYKRWVNILKNSK